MNDITVEQIIGIHDAVIGTGGGDSRLLSEATLHDLVFRANRIEDPHCRAAFALFSLCAYPPFREGNEQMAVRIARQILAECFLPSPDNECFTRLIAGVMSFTIEPEDIEQVFRNIASNSTR